ncbi:uncharacterized protein LOC134221943 [Armigeres subalbatus]|uniref:uncharacterized protein LOC134221943 n=1 Tax=Armigeres subalbatus TaxID=124917 RepID=UPI002ED4245E
MEKKKTNKRQFSRLVSFMEENPELARGSKFIARDSVTSLWWKITDSLNSLGPPNRSVAAWQKVWTDKKLQLRRKLQHNKTELTATGGGPNSLHSFNDLEETIIRLLSLERAVNHNGSVFGTQLASGQAPGSSGMDENQNLAEVSAGEPQAIEDEEPTRDNAAREDEARGQSNGRGRGRGRTTKRNFRKALLEKQTDDLYKIKRHQMILDKEKNRNQQLDYQLQMLQYKKQKLDFEMRRKSEIPEVRDESDDE